MTSDFQDAPPPGTAAPLLPDVGVIALVPERWGETWQPRQHVLSRLARYYRVAWVNPAPDWRLALRHPGWFRVADPRPAPNLVVHSPDRLLPRIYRPPWLAERLLALRVAGARRLLRRAGCRRIVLYIWRPEFAAMLALCRYDLSCYHIDDEYSFSPDPGSPSEAERRLLTGADRVIIHSPGLFALKGALNRHTTLIPNGVDYEAFARPAPEPADLAGIPHPRIGYLGWLKRELDWPLLLELTGRHPGWSFVFVGGWKNPETEPFRPALARRPNVYLLGSKPTAAVGAYPQHFDACILPYVRNGYTDCIYPMKLHEYLASGRPVVGTPIATLREFAGLVALPETRSEWSEALAASLDPAADTAEQRDRRREVARAHDWSALTARIAGVMASGLGAAVAGRLRALTSPDQAADPMTPASPSRPEPGPSPDQAHAR